ncbi:hypothetical protein GCM10010353_69200 [Streptomyces chryseus]|nr:hypothetical protein GCM10010353_69200 [Streptomyces chryseus]
MRELSLMCGAWRGSNAAGSSSRATAAVTVAVHHSGWGHGVPGERRTRSRPSSDIPVASPAAALPSALPVSTSLWAISARRLASFRFRPAVLQAVAGRLPSWPRLTALSCGASRGPAASPPPFRWVVASKAGIRSQPTVWHGSHTEQLVMCFAW